MGALAAAAIGSHRGRYVTLETQSSMFPAATMAIHASPSPAIAVPTSTGAEKACVDCDVVVPHSIDHARDVAPL